jgi:DNA polymerase III epsilon subunit-like protein
MIHLNGNMLCAVDVETTGEIPGHHDMWQVCFLPLNEKLEPSKEVLPFYMDLLIKRPENVNLEAIKNQHRFIESQKGGVDPWFAADLFDEWFQKLNLGFRKMISPLAQNWVFDRGFVADWMGNESFNQYVDARYRDTMVAALYLNDAADFAVEQTPFPKVNLAYLCSQLKIEHDKAHDALADCVVTAEIYRKMVMRRY